MIEVEKKIMMFLKEDDRKISKTRVPLTNVIETRVYIKNILKKGEKSKAKKIYKLLLQRIINAGKKGIKIDQNIFEELNILKNLKL